MSREAFAEVARSNTMTLVTNMGEYLKNDLRDILAQNIQEGKGSREAAAAMAEHVDTMSNTRAMAIARTETTRATNLGNLYGYQDKGYQSYTVNFTDKACDGCVKFYANRVFDINDVDSLPPHHTNCACVAIFHRETPEEFADKYGYDVYGPVDENEGVSTPIGTTNPQTGPSLPGTPAEVKSLENTLSEASDADLQDLISAIAPDVEGTENMTTQDLTGATREYLADPTEFTKDQPAKAAIVLALLAEMLQNKHDNEENG